MKMRFRIKRADKEEGFDDVEAFQEAVRAGRVEPGDLVYDALTGEWAPARVHPAFLDSQTLPDEPPKQDLDLNLVPDQDLDPIPDSDAESPADVTPPPGTGDEEAGDPDLSLVEEVEPDPAVQDAAFIKEMEQERLDEGEHRKDRKVDPMVFEGLESATPEPSWDPSPPPRAPSWAEEHEETSQGQPDPGGRSYSRSVLSIVAVAFLGLAALGFLFMPSLLTLVMPEAADSAGAGAAVVPPPGDEELATRAHTRFLLQVQGLRRSFQLGSVPQSWLSGGYLAEASDHPEVQAFWEGYEDFVDSVRTTESDLYREAYLSVLGDAGVEGPLRTLKLRQGMSDFSSAVAIRQDAYDRSLELTASALELHRFLVQVQEAISYEPARSERLSADPVTEAVGRDAETQDALDAALDRVLDALDAVGRDQSAVAGSDPRWLGRMLGRTGP